MKFEFSKKAYKQYIELKKDKALYKRFKKPTTSIAEDPYEGIGKPELLKHHLAGYWSRRVTQEHRLVYRVVQGGDGAILQILQCLYHYEEQGLSAVALPKLCRHTRAAIGPSPHQWLRGKGLHRQAIVWATRRKSPARFAADGASYVLAEAATD